MSAPKMRDPKCIDLDDAVQEVIWWLGDELAKCCVGAATHERGELVRLANACLAFGEEDE